MVKFESTENRPRVVFLSSITISVVLGSLFLFGALLVNLSRGETAYTQVDMAAGSIFVFVITMIISLSLLPKVTEKLENRAKSEKILK
ncbi:MAG: hypothetical protein NHB15_12710 [Methanosarcina barkeri]|nr:hypothetical protein [Methanosarcina sp. ERenArc_MAG2]